MNNNLAIDDIKLSSFDASNIPSNLSVLPKDNSNLLFNQLDILEEFNQYKFLRPMKKKMYIILNRLNNSDNKHNKNSKRNKKLFKKVNKIAVNIDLINDMPVGNAIIAEDMIMQSKNALFEVGDIVDVAPRMWPGSNKEGGTARIICINMNEVGGFLYNVRYTVVGGSEKNVEEKYIRQNLHITHCLSKGLEERRSVMLGRCKVEHCPCFIKDCNHIQPGDPGYEEQQNNNNLFSHVKIRSGTGGKVISLVRDKLNTKQRSNFNIESEMFSSNKFNNNNNTSIRKSKKHNPKKHAARVLARDKIDVSRTNKEMLLETNFWSEDSLQRLQNPNIKTIIDNKSVNSTPMILNAANVSNNIHITTIYQEILTLHANEMETNGDVTFMDDNYNPKQSIIKQIFNKYLVKLSFEELFQLSEICMNQLKSGIERCIHLKQKAVRLRDKISKVNSTFISENFADIMSRAVQILAITDEFYLLNMQLERTVFDIFHIMHRHAHNALKVLSSDASKMIKKDWSVKYRCYNNVVEEWRDERCSTNDSIKALHSRFEYENNMTAEEALEENDDEDIDSTAEGLNYASHLSNDYTSKKKIGTSIRNKIKKNAKNTINRKFVSDFNNNNDINNDKKNTATIHALSSRPYENAFLSNSNQDPERRRVHKTLAQLTRNYQRNDINSSNNYLLKKKIHTSGQLIDNSWIENEAPDATTYGNNYINNLALDYSIHDRNDIDNDDITGKLNNFTDDDLDMYFSSDEDIFLTTTELGNTQINSSLKGEAIITTFLELIPRNRISNNDNFIDCDLLSPSISTLDKYNNLCEYSNDRILDTLNEIRGADVGLIIIEDIYRLFSQWHERLYPNNNQLSLMYDYDKLLAILYCNNCSIFDHLSLKSHQLEILHSYIQIQEHFESTVLFNCSIVDDTTCVPSLGLLISACIDGKLATCGVVIRALEYIRCKILKFNSILSCYDSIPKIQYLIRTELYRVLKQFILSALKNQMIITMMLDSIIANKTHTHRANSKFYSSVFQNVSKMFIFVWYIVVNSLLKLDTNCTNIIGESFVHKPWQFVNNIMINYSATGNYNEINTNIADSKLNSVVSIVDFETLGKCSINSESVWLITAIHSFALTESNKIGSNWAIIRRFCSTLDIFIMKSHDESLNYMKEYFTRVLVLAKMWDSPGDGLECLLQLISEHTLYMSSVQKSCCFHGSAQSTNYFNASNSSDKIRDGKFDQYLITTVRKIVDKCYSNSLIQIENLNNTIFYMITMLFELCNYGDFTSNSYCCPLCNSTWSYAILFRGGFRKYLLACINTSANCNSIKGVDSLVGKRLKLACIRQDGLLRLLQKDLNDTSFYQWSILGLLVAELTSLFGCNIFEEVNHDGNKFNTPMGSSINNNQLLKKLLSMNTLQETQLSCLLWLFCGFSFSPFIRINSSNCLQSPLLDLTRTEFYRICHDINVNSGEDTPFFISNTSSNNLLLSNTSVVMKNLMLIIVISSLTLTISIVNDIIGQNSNRQVTIQDFLPLRLLMGSSMICNLSIFGPRNSTHSVVSLLSISVAFSSLQSITRVIATQISQILPDNEKLIVNSVLQHIDNIINASILLIVPLMRAPITSLLNFGIESSNNFCFAVDNYEDVLSFLPYILVKSLSQLVLTLCWQKSCNNIENRLTYTSKENKVYTPLELINLIESILSGSLRYQDSNLSIIPSWLHCILWQPLLVLIANHITYIQGVPLENESKYYLVNIKYCYDMICSKATGNLFIRLIFDTWTCVVATNFSQPLISNVICFPSFHNSLSVICQYLSKESSTRLHSNLLDSRIVEVFQFVPVITDPMLTIQYKLLLQSVYASLGNLIKLIDLDDNTPSMSLVLSPITSSNNDSHYSISLGNVFIRCSRHVLLCAFKAYDHDRFNLLKHGHYIRSLFTSFVQAMSIASACTVFTRRDIIECINSVLINDFAIGGILNCIRTIVTAQNIAINQQETSLYLLSLPLYIRCIPVLAFSTRQLEWEALLHVYIVACNKCAQHYNAATDKNDIELLDFYSVGNFNQYAPIEIKLILIWCISLVLSNTEDILDLINRLELVKDSTKYNNNLKKLIITILPLLKVFREYDFISNISRDSNKNNYTDTFDDRLKQLCRYLLLYDKPWNDCEVILNNNTLNNRPNQIQKMNNNKDNNIVGTIPAAILNGRIFLNTHINSIRVILNNLNPSIQNYNIFEDEIITLLCCSTIASIKIMRVLLGELPIHVDSTTNNLVDIINVNVILLSAITDCTNLRLLHNTDITELTSSIMKSIITLLSSVVTTNISNMVNNDQVANIIITNSYKIISLICKSYNCPECDQLLLVTSKAQYTKSCNSSVCLLCNGGAFIKELITQVNHLSRNHSTNISSKIYYRQLEFIPIKMYILKDQINHILLNLNS